MMSPWPPFLRWFLGTFLGLLALAAGFVVLMNPFGNLPVSGGWPHVILDQHQRYHYPAIARSGIHDSAIFGTSSARLLEPQRLSAGLGGRFANFAMNAAMAWEQVQLAKLYLDSVPAPHAVLFALDWLWCDGAADIEDQRSAAAFPSWLYDNHNWNDWLYLLNANALRTSRHRLLGDKPLTIDADGYGVFVPPESKYDAAKSHIHLWRGRKPTIPPLAPDYEPTDAELAAWRFPALPWLDELLGTMPAETVRIVAFMPPHVADHAAPGTREAARIKLCKAKVAEIARRHRAHYLDFWIRSPITLEDTNYWDRVHYRVPIGTRITDDIALAVSGRGTISADFAYQPPANRVLP